MDQLTLIMEKINLYIQDPFGMLTICTAPIIGYYAVKLYLKPRLNKDKKEENR